MLILLQILYNFSYFFIYFFIQRIIEKIYAFFLILSSISSVLMTLFHRQIKTTNNLKHINWLNHY